MQRRALKTQLIYCEDHRAGTVVKNGLHRPGAPAGNIGCQTSPRPDFYNPLVEDIEEHRRQHREGTGATQEASMAWPITVK
jgi:hypothetical protein